MSQLYHQSEGEQMAPDYPFWGFPVRIFAPVELIITADLNMHVFRIWKVLHNYLSVLCYFTVLLKKEGSYEGREFEKKQGDGYTVAGG